jgi:hypothetical protein
MIILISRSNPSKRLGMIKVRYTEEVSQIARTGSASRRGYADAQCSPWMNAPGAFL